MISQTVCIKIGGRAAAIESVLQTFADEIKAQSGEKTFLLVHGGGAEVSSLSKVLGLEPQFKDGIRMTSVEEMAIVDMVLAGKVNKYIVRTLYGRGMLSVGISGCDGGLIIGTSLDGETRTGRPTEVHPELIGRLHEAKMIPVISSVAMDKEGNALNINADDAALALAAALEAETLIFVSDIPGILKEGEVITGMTPEEAEAEISAGVISGGMIPKVRASAGALENGVSRVVIGGYEKNGDLHNLLAGTSGTTLHREI